MAIFSPSARQLIDKAVADAADPRQRKIWHDWTAANPELRKPGEDWRHAQNTLPVEVVATAFYVLEETARRLRRELERANLSEDEISYLDNDLSHILSVEKFVLHAAQERGPP
jgi:hypothetical protein